MSSSHNCIISAMRMGEVALLGVTAENASQPVSFDFHQVNGTGSYRLTDLATGKVVRSASPRVSFAGTLETTAVFRFAPPEKRDESKNDTATLKSLKVDDESNPAQSPVSISVIDHGADPTGVADSTEAFRSALAAAAAPGPGNASTGIPVVVPSGTYLVTGEVNVTEQTLMGAGPAAWVSDGSPQPKIVFRPFGSDPQGSAFVHPIDVLVV